LSLFSSMDIQFKDMGLDSGHRVNIDVKERKPGLVQFGFGANNQRDFTLRGYAGLLYRNLWGSARAINTRIELQSSVLQTTFLEHRAFVSFFEPFIFGTNISGRLTVDSAENIYEITKTPTMTIFDSKGFDFLLEHQVNKNIKATWTVFGFDFIKEYEID